MGEVVADRFQLDPAFVVSDEAGLRALFPAVHEVAVRKCIDHLDQHARDFVARSPFLCIGTETAEGRADVSPRGDPCGFVKVLDDRTLLIPDRPGNNRLDTLSNIAAHPSVGLLFLIPGFDETLRVNGTARLTRDPALLARLAVNDRAPRLAIVVDVAEVFLHCAKAFRRSRLWDPAAQQDRRGMPTLLKMIHDQTEGTPEAAEETARREAALEEDYRASMY